MKAAIGIAALAFAVLSSSLAGAEETENNLPPPEATPSSANFDYTIASPGYTPPRRIPGGTCYKHEHVARALRPSGATILSYKIEPDGSVEGITLLQSSGVDGLDEMTIACAQSYRYAPATKDGQPVEVPWKFHVNWAARHP